MDRFTVMKSFVAVVRQETFASAARSLAISRALVSRHIADLERQVSVRLVNRTTRSVSLTEAGKKYLKFAQRILAEIATEDASLVAMRDDPEGELAVASSPWIGTLALGDAVAAFAAQHPKIRVRLDLNGQSERTYKFIEEGYDVAFHTKQLRDSSIKVKKIAPLKFAHFAAPQYLQKHSMPRTPQDLANHDSLVHVINPVWHFSQGGKRSIFKPRKIVFSSNSYLVLRKAAIQGMGIAELPMRAIGRHLQSGELVQVLADCEAPERPLYAAFAPNRHLVKKVRVFLDFIGEWFKAHPTISASDEVPAAARNGAAQWSGAGTVNGVSADRLTVAALPTTWPSSASNNARRVATSSAATPAVTTRLMASAKSPIT